MSVLIATNLRKELSGTPLFDGVTFTVRRKDRLALSGPNGAGKTTLLRCLAGQTDLQGGELVIEKGARIALHDQRPPRDRGLKLGEYVVSGASALVQIEEELRTLEQAMAGGDHGSETLARYGRLQERLEHAGGYAWRDRASANLRGLGFRDGDLERSLATFSGGELTRASLARALSGDPDLLLLDEPTNHLDVESIEWLEQTLESLDAAVVLVAHDRWFLEATTTAVLELEAGRSLFFSGPWHQWRLEKAGRAANAQRTAQRLSNDIVRLERFVERFRYKKTKARQAQAKLTQIGRLQTERGKASAEHELLTRNSRRLGFEFLKPPRSGRTVLEAHDLTVSAGTRTLLEDVSVVIERGEHIALVGRNGSGKTTLVERLLEEETGYGVVTTYFSQHGTELEERGSVLDCAQRMTGLKRSEAATLLGRFLFSGRDAHDKQVSVLSGGERRRLSLAVAVASGANFLVLDEPTNHLDLESREALEEALEAFPGTVLLISHDRAVLDAVARRTLAIEDGRLRSHDGGWADYQGRDDAPAAAEEPPAKKPKPAPSRPARAASRRPSELELVEREIARCEEEVADIELRLAEDWGDVELLAAHRRSRDELRVLLERWEGLFEQAQA